LIPETAQVVAYRCKIPGDAAAEMLAAMWQKGLILRLESEGKPIRYMASQFVVGIWEFQVNRLTPELVADMATYIPVLLDADTWRRAPQMRTIPVNRSIDPKLPVLPHEAAANLIRSKDHFVISPCICRKEQRMAGHGCDAPLEACISFRRCRQLLCAIGHRAPGEPTDGVGSSGDRRSFRPCSSAQQQPQSGVDLLLLRMLLRGAAHD
jgi:electron transport complex protein RnfB